MTSHAPETGLPTGRSTVVIEWTTVLRQIGHRWLARVLLVTFGAWLVVVSIGNLQYAAPGWRLVDWRSYHESALRLLEGTSMYAPLQFEGPYRLADSAGQIFVYPPTGMLVLLPFAGPSYGAYPWLVFSVAVFALGCGAVIVRETGGLPGLVVGLFLAVLALSRVFTEAVLLANASFLVGGLVGLAYAGRPGISGALTGAIKILPGVVLFIGGRRAWVTAIVTTAVLVAATLVLWGVQPWIDYATVIGNARPACGDFTSVACVLTAATGPRVAAAVTVALGVSIAALALVVRDRLAKLALVTIAMLVGQLELAPTTNYGLYAGPLVAAILSRAWLRWQAGAPRTT